VDDPARLIRGGVDHALALEGHPEVLGRVGGGVVGHHVPAGVVSGVVLAAAVALFAADVDLAGGADVVAGVDLRLGRVGRALHVEPAQFVGVDHDPLFAGFRVELDEVGVVAVLRGADVHLAVLPLAEREIARLIGVGLGQDVVRGAVHIPERRGIPGGGRGGRGGGGRGS